MLVGYTPLDQLKLLKNDFNETGIDIFVKRGMVYNTRLKQKETIL